ncbi:MAG: response regulator [Planctomycetes bacterium]|nr:response regulator [Planctomycetota bacterium]
MNQPCIVIIDDNPADIELVGIAFGMREITVHMRTAGDGEQGIALLARLEVENLIPRLVLLDLNMPRVSGFEVLAFIRGRAALAAMPVIVFSSTTAPRDRVRSIELGATEFMAKPDDLSALLVLIDRLGTYVTTPAP